jgi:Endonuclease/Exonuclease/phosphatase family
MKGHGYPHAFRLRRIALVVTAATAVSLMGIVQSVQAGPPPTAPPQFSTMTYNLYLGANLQPLFGLSGDDLTEAAAAAYAHMEQTDFPARAKAIARQIEEEMPVAVGLQEVALWQRGPDPAHLTPTFDFLAILLDALADEGLEYKAAAQVVNFSGTLPIAVDLSLWGSFTDRDVIIVRSDMKVANPSGQNFDASVLVPLGGDLIEVPRGWTSVDVTFHGRSYRLADTHLEAFDAGVRTAQAVELRDALAQSPLPVILMGDLNSRSDDTTGPYGILQAAGFVDSWTETMGGTPGDTSGQPDDLDCTLPTTIDHRIDYVLHNEDGIVDGVVGSGEVVGEEPKDCTKTEHPLWPSDHAGVVVSLAIATP